jgi:hypothetical protein
MEVKTFTSCPRCKCKQLAFAIAKNNENSLVFCLTCAFVLAEVEIKKSGTDCRILEPFDKDWEMHVKINEFFEQENI